MLEKTIMLYIVNAKSIMGIFSLDLTKPLVMVAHTDSHAELLRAIAPFEYTKPNKQDYYDTKIFRPKTTTY